MLRHALRCSGTFVIILAFFYFLSGALAATATIGEPAPNWQLNDVNGRVVQLSDFAGKVVLINFFRTTCAPCLWEVPDFSALQSQYGSEGLVVIGVAALESAEILRPFIAELGINYTVCPSDEAMLWDYNVLPMGVIPVSAIIDRNGVMVDFYLYYHPKTHHEEIIKPLLLAAGGPSLRMKRTGSEIELSWPTNATGFVLEFRNSYSSDPNWQQVTNRVTSSNDLNRVRLSRPGLARFFRLRKS